MGLCSTALVQAPVDERLTSVVSRDVDVLMEGVIPARVDASHTHLTAQFRGVPPDQLRDATLLGGLLIAAASAGGFSPIGVPTVKQHRSGSVSAVLLLDGAHLTLHALPDRQTLLFDVIAPPSHDFRKVMEVFARRLTARDITSDTRTRG